MRKWMVTIMLFAGLSCMITGCEKGGFGKSDNTTVINMESDIAGLMDVPESGNTSDTRDENNETSDTADTQMDSELDSRPEDSNLDNTKESGMVKAIHDQFFTVQFVHTEPSQTGDGLIAVYSPDEDKETAVYFNEETIFKIMDVKNNGLDPENDVTYRDASSQNLIIDNMVEVEGRWDGDVYHAQVVYIYNFI